MVKPRLSTTSSRCFWQFARTAVGKATESQRSDAGSPAHNSLNANDRKAIFHGGSASRSQMIVQAFITILTRQQGIRHTDREYGQKPTLPQGAAFAVRCVSQ